MKLTKDPDSGNYIAFYTNGDGRRHQSATGTPNLEEARAIVRQANLAQMETAAKAGLLAEDALAKMTVGRRITCARAVEQWRDWYAEGHDIRSTMNFHGIMEQFLNFLSLHDRPLSCVNERVVNQFLNAPDGTHRTTRILRKKALKSLFVFCSARGYVSHNPAVLARVDYNLLTHHQKEMIIRPPFTEAEYRHIMANVGDAKWGFWKAATAISYWTGLRLGDVANLEWGSILPDAIIVWTRKRDKRVKIDLDNPHIGGGELREILAEVRRNKDDDRYCFRHAAALSNDPRQRSQLSTQFSNILKRLGIMGKSFHSLRHSFVTRLSQAGVSLEQIGEIVGHSDKYTTSKYDHSRSTREERAKNAKKPERDTW